MDRRRALQLTTGAMGMAIGWSKPANALLNCSGFNYQGVQLCEAGLDSDAAGVVAAAVGGQHLSQWCWAASIEMVFAYYGHRVPQETIVQQTWGGIANVPGQPQQILGDLNRGWLDEDGEAFSVRGDVYSANQVTASQDLAGNMPLIIGTMGHCMVLTSLRYVINQAGRGNVQAAVVRDPWPGRGRRVLSPVEWNNTNFLVRIRIA